MDGQTHSFTPKCACRVEEDKRVRSLHHTYLPYSRYIRRYLGKQTAANVIQGGLAGCHAVCGGESTLGLVPLSPSTYNPITLNNTPYLHTTENFLARLTLFISR